MGQPAPPTDKIFDILVNLAQEVWVLADRQRVTEQVLAELGIDIAELVDRHQPDAELRDTLDAEREAFMQRVLAPALGD